MQLIKSPGKQNRFLGVLAWMSAAAMPVLWPCVHAANGAAVNSPAVPVITSKVTQEDVASYRTGIGTVQPMQSVTIKARVDGQLEKVAFTEGQDIKQGDLLAQIDPRPYQTQLNQALAQKAHDEASLTAALKDLDRYTKLVAQGVIQRQTLDAQQATVDQLKANLQSDQAQIENARVQLGYTTIRSPVNGRAGMRLIDAGNMVRAADTNGLVVINQIDPIAVLFTLPEDDFQTVNQAIQKSGKNSLSVTALARHGDTPLGTGRLLLLNNQIDTSTGTFQLKALFPNPMHALWPGQYVNVRLQVGARRTVLTVPESAVQRGPDGLFVYVVQPDSTVTAQTIRTAQTQDGKTVIDEGLAVGERVVVDGQFKIKPGTKVVEARQTAIPAANAKQQTSARP